MDNSVKYCTVTNVVTKNFQFDPKTDLIPGVYEGGFTLWECTTDMLQYLDNVNMEGKRVIDVGCGLGILGVKCLKLGASKVTFQDYNEETYDQVIKAQLRHNGIMDDCEFIYGDWTDLAKQGKEDYDIAIASEVIYREENYTKIIAYLSSVLAKHGVCYMINKCYYFGVGGSNEGFKDALKQQSTLAIKEEIIINNKKSNKKAILILQKQ